MLQTDREEIAERSHGDEEHNGTAVNEVLGFYASHGPIRFSI